MQIGIILHNLIFLVKKIWFVSESAEGNPSLR